MTLTQIESYNFTQEIMKKLTDWSGQSTAGFIGSRIAGPLISPFLAAADVFFHTICAVGKMISGCFVLPYNWIASHINKKYKAPHDLELSSAAVHFLAIGKIIVFLPVIFITSAFNPYLAEKNADIRSIFSERRFSENLSLGF